MSGFVWVRAAMSGNPPELCRLRRARPPRLWPRRTCCEARRENHPDEVTRLADWFVAGLDDPLARASWGIFPALGPTVQGLRADLVAVAATTPTRIFRS